jgi:hypothetical protein
VKKFFGLVIALAGVVITLIAGEALLLSHRTYYGFHAVYVGLLGVALLSGGIIMRQD